MIFFNNFGDYGYELPVEFEVLGFFSEIAIWLFGFIFTAIASFQMAKRRGLKNAWLAFIPFAQWALIGKLAGESNVFGKIIKNAGLFVAIFSGSVFLLETIYNLGYYIDLFARFFDVTITFNSAFIQDFLFTNKYLFIYEIISWLVIVIDIIYIFFEVTVVFQIFRRYRPQSATLYAILSIFFEFTFGIFLFTVRKNNPVNYQDYMRSRYYTNYNRYNGYNPYGTYNGQNANNYNPQNEKKVKEEDPFPEFSNKDDFTSGSGNDKNDYFN
ncbi:MAG: hypothetical protein IKL82_06390 [Clostridia bacterium]|nr:hypothetical protein [Clostridia bacterium]